MSARIPPLEPPYTPEVEAELRRWMGAVDREPLKLFRTLVLHEALAQRMFALGSGVLGRAALLAPREREVLIHRTCALAGAEYEWGVHASVFAPRVGLTPEQLTATVARDPSGAGWSVRDRLLLAAADELHASCRLSDELFARLSRHWTPAEMLEIAVVVGWYRLLAGVIGVARIELEEGVPRFPSRRPAA